MASWEPDYPERHPFNALFYVALTYLALSVGAVLLLLKRGGLL
jgi:hypothetical protein